MNLQKIIRPVVFVVLFLIPIFPLIVADTYFFPFITGKAFYFRILVEIAFAGWLILAFADAKYRPRFTPLTLTVTLFAVVTLLADLLGVNPLRSVWSNFERMEGWLVIAHLWAFFMTMVHFFGPDAEGRKWWNRWLNATLMVATIVGIYGLVQSFGWAPIHQGSTRIDASLGNAAYMAVYMLIHAFLAAYMFFSTRMHKVHATGLQWLYGIGAVVFSYLVFLTATRGTILGLLGGILLSLALYAIFGNKEPAKWRGVSAGIIAVLVLIGVVFWMNRDADFIKNNEVLNRLASISLNETKTQARGYIWPMAITGFKDRPILGWGQENFNYIFNSNYNPKMWNQEQWFDRAHSVYLDWLTASGVLGLAVYLALYALLFVIIWKSALGIKEKSVLSGLVAAYAVHNIFVFDNLASYVLFFAVLGYVNSYSAWKKINWLGSGDMSKDAVEYVVAPIVVIALVAGLYFLNVRPIQANTRLITALVACNNGKPDVTLFEKVLSLNQYMANQEAREQIFGCASNIVNNENFPGPTRAALNTLASREVDAQIAATPKDARIYALGGSYFNVTNQFSKAVPLLEEAAKQSPGKQSIGLQLAGAYVNSGKTQEALDLLSKMYNETPNHTEVRNTYVRVLIYLNREAEAKAIFKDDPTAFENRDVAQLYAAMKKYSQSLEIYKKLAAANPKDFAIRTEYAQVLYLSGMKGQSVAELKLLQTEFPEYKTQLDEWIKQLSV
jgi:O-antigen ligase/tetratricopeptide (TPR) repeat protein